MSALFCETSESNQIQTLIFKNVDFENLTVDQALLWVVTESRKIDPKGKGIDLIFEKIDSDHPTDKLTLHLQNRSVMETLRIIIRHYSWIYRLEGNTIVVMNAGCWGAPDDQLICRAYRVPRKIFLDAGAVECNGMMDVKSQLKDFGLDFPPGTFARYQPNTQILILKNSEKNLAAAEAVIQLREQETVFQLNKTTTRTERRP